MAQAEAAEAQQQDRDVSFADHWRTSGWKAAVASAHDIARVEAARWDQLSQNALEENPYLSRQYFLAGLNNIDKYSDLRALLVSDDSGRLLGFFPFRRLWGAAYAANNRYQFTGTPLVDRDRASAVLAAWLESMKRSKLPSTAVLKGIPLDGEFASRIRALAPQLGLTAVEANEYHRPRLTRRYSSFQAHCNAVISPRRRRELERSTRRLQELGELRFERIADPDEVRQHLQEFLSLELAGWKGSARTALASRPQTLAFAREAFGGQAGREGLAILDQLLLDGRPIAFSLNIATGKTLFTPKGTYDETLRQFSPGLVLEYLIVRDFYEGRGADFEAMDSSTTIDGHVVQGLWNETARMGALIVGRPAAAAVAARLERSREDMHRFVRTLRLHLRGRGQRSKPASDKPEPRSATSAKWGPGSERRSEQAGAVTAPLDQQASRTRHDQARRVLVIGDDMRIFLSVARSLGRAGLEVHAMPFDWRAPALRSRYVHTIHRFPRYGDDPAIWLKSFRELQLANDFELVIPTCDRAIYPLHEHRELLADIRLAIPDAAAMPLLFDKEETRRMCAELGIPTANGDQLGGGTAEDLASKYGLPLIIKPRQSYRIDQLDTWGRVWIVDTIEELRELLRQLPDRSRYLVESQFQGEGVGLSVLAHHGQIHHAFQHRRLREGRGGSSSYRVSESVNPVLLDAAVKIATRVGLSGVCMFEFRENPATGRWILLETNARFWGSMSLPVSLGVDFPLYLFDQVVDGTSHPTTDYSTGVRSRNLLLDGRNLLSTLTDPSRPPWRQIIRDLADFIGQPIRWATGQERSDSIVMDDLAPAVAEFLALFGRIGRGRRAGEKQGRRRSEQAAAQAAKI